MQNFMKKIVHKGPSKVKQTKPLTLAQKIQNNHTVPLDISLTNFNGYVDYLKSEKAKEIRSTPAPRLSRK